MEQKIIVIIFSGFLLGCGCSREELPPTTTENGILIEKPYIWWNKEGEHDQSITTIGILFNNSFLCESKMNNTSSLALTDVRNGSNLWKWNSYSNSNDLSIAYPYFYKNYLYILSGSPRSYCLDLNTGKEIWKKEWENGIYYKSSGFKDEVYVLQDFADGTDKYPGFYILDLFTGNIKEKIIPVFKNTNLKNVLGELGSIRGVHRFDTLNKIFYLVTYAESINFSKATPLIGLYNYTDKKWVYEYKTITNLETTSKGLIAVVNGKIYHEGETRIFCNDLWTGDSIWTQKFKGNFLFGSCLVDNGTIYCASEGDGYYALDAETGAIKWKGDRAPGTSSRMVILNGVLYYINGADGRLWALDAATGKTLWKLKSPDNNFGFKREINVMKGDALRKGYVMTSTWHGACAYEAER